MKYTTKPVHCEKCNKRFRYSVKGKPREWAFYCDRCSKKVFRSGGILFVLRCRTCEKPILKGHFNWRYCGRCRE